MFNICSHGVATWAELSVSDARSPVAFYADLLGWSFAERTSRATEHWIASVDGTEVVGVVEAPPDHGSAAAWTISFDVADLAEAVAAVRSAGGTVLDVPFPVPGGRGVLAADPSGATLGLVSWNRRRRWLSNDPGAACWVELVTSDLPAAEAFYASVLGWKAQPSAHAASYTTFCRDGSFVAGATTTSAEGAIPAPAWSVYVAVTDCAAVERRAEELGGTVRRPTTDVAAGRFAVLADRDGATFQVIELAG